MEHAPYCYHCGQEIPTSCEVRFCGFCGSALCSVASITRSRQGRIVMPDRTPPFGTPLPGPPTGPAAGGSSASNPSLSALIVEEPPAALPAAVESVPFPMLEHESHKSWIPLWLVILGFIISGVCVGYLYFINQ